VFGDRGSKEMSLVLHATIGSIFIQSIEIHSGIWRRFRPRHQGPDRDDLSTIVGGLLIENRRLPDARLAKKDNKRVTAKRAHAFGRAAIVSRASYNLHSTI
jgi:hypothetical protein